MADTLIALRGCKACKDVTYCYDRASRWLQYQWVYEYSVEGVVVQRTSGTVVHGITCVVNTIAAEVVELPLSGHK